jgi:integrase
LTVAEAKQLRALLTYDDKAIGRDLPDLVSFMLGTGCPIGEAAGLLWEDVDLEDGTVTMNRTVVRLYGRGLTSKPTKSGAGERTLALPSWCVETLLARPRTDPIFPAILGGWRDPSIRKRIFGKRSEARAIRG